MKIFLDDLRECPNGWIQARNYNEMIKLLEENKAKVEEISLDHDLGETKTGYDICKYLVENDFWFMSKITIHTANAVGAKNMYELLDRYAPKNIKIYHRFANI